MRINQNDQTRRAVTVGHTVELDGVGIETAYPATTPCRACGESTIRDSGGWGQVCFDCGEPR